MQRRDEDREAVLNWALGKIVSDLCDAAVQQHVPLSRLVGFLEKRYPEAKVEYFRRSAWLQLTPID